MTHSQNKPTRDSSQIAAPAQIGPYKVLSVIGEGGMGIVYLAEQEKPVRRRVALKLIKPGMGSKAILARFEAERQALALMDHPSIATVFEAGTTEPGQPFFAMEYVKGLSLTDYCNRNRLSLQDRLKLFIEICHGVQHAHQKAVIHRDLKPSNILVSENEGKPTPKIIDFGLAKALGGQQLTEKSLYTEQGVLVGTPEYMSPEQVDPSALDVDTRTDIYSLGAILYQLLTGTLPFDTEDLREAAQVAAILSIRKRICEEYPEKPSTRLGSLALTQGATQKGMLEPPSFTRRVRGDLDWITMKALEKDRARRYGTAADLAADIERHLNHEPVLAGPPSAVYRLKKFARKNAGLVASVLSLFVLLVTGGVTSTIFWVRAEEAKENEAKQKTIAVKARDLAQENEQLALEKENEAVVARRREREQREEAEQQRDEVLRLSDIKRLQELEEEAADLWPAHPEKIAALEDWLRRANALTENIDLHKTSLADLRQQASHPSEKDKEIGIWKFDTMETQWRHDILFELVTKLQGFSSPNSKSGTIADVEKRLALARTIRYETIEKFEVKWEEAITSIRKECPQYNGLSIKPQIGLTPIGRDPLSGLWEFAHFQTGEIPERTEDGKLTVSTETGIVFVLIPGGTFWMGAQKKDPNAQNYDKNAEKNEGPVHEVKLRPFFLSKYEMTQAQWERFVEKNPSGYIYPNYRERNPTSPRKKKHIMGLHPVEQVSWEDCHEVMGRLSLSLPTEAQWEYAARAGTTTAYSTGNEISSLQGSANLADAYAKKNGAPSTWPFQEDLDDGYVIHAPIGKFKANRFGLYDMQGNVWEWCLDWIGRYGQPTDPATGERKHTGGRQRVGRGGGFGTTAPFSRSAGRTTFSPDLRADFLGVRPAKNITD